MAVTSADRARSIFFPVGFFSPQGPLPLSLPLQVVLNRDPIFVSASTSAVTSDASPRVHRLGPPELTNRFKVLFFWPLSSRPPVWHLVSRHSFRDFACSDLSFFLKPFSFFLLSSFKPPFASAPLLPPPSFPYCSFLFHPSVVVVEFFDPAESRRGRLEESF